ncbi:Crp/Fnr family transcriptional regulator [Longirhabdus pacifica]|uniref:Crp/Fnr family transcriptional regulator n=1 Tax=Longirhabdus pacifica TaxID=2305227 RepID=UPI0010086AFB|nr:cyclic nucleotide-binding domain-containing protein [Longirhabdus pacifica]
MKIIEDKDKLNGFLDKFQLKTVLNDSILPHLSLCLFEPGEYICSEGDELTYLHVLVQGKVKVHTTSPEGKTLILSFISKLEVFGDVEYIQRLKIMNTVESVSPTYMLRVHHKKLQQYTQEDVKFLQFMLDIITKKFHLKSTTMRFNLLYPVEVRLASYLLSITYDENDALLHTQLSSSRLTDIANLIGTSYRHVNRVIQKFCEQGLTERSKNKVEIKDVKGLKKITGQSIYEPM